MNSPPALPRDRRSWRRFCHGILLVSISLAASLALCEAALRIAYPRYGHLAEPPVTIMQRVAQQGSLEPGHTRSSNAAVFQRPDSGDIHALLFNEFGNRQHRSFGASDLRDGVNVAFFGDSFTENRYVPAPYSFPEVLDYLLNAQAAQSAQGTPINVLNFGFEGTELAFQYARYNQLPQKAEFAHVFYVHCDNDFRDLRQDLLFKPGSRALADYVNARPAPKTWLSGLHVSYLVLDVWHRLIATTPADDDGQREAPDIDTASTFREILLAWRTEVEANGGAFHVVLLPLPGTAQQFNGVDWPTSLSVLDLAPCFQDAFSDETAWRFQTDAHWNEAGNMVAADCLYRFLEGRLGLPTASDAAISADRHIYYETFAQDPGWTGYRWTPPPRWVTPQPFSATEATAIRAKYLSLESPQSDPRQQLIVWANESEPQVRAGGWEVYAHKKRKHLFYVRSDCPDADPTAGLFLRVFAPSSDMPAHGEASLEVERRNLLVEVQLGDPDERTMWRDGRECYVLVDLDYWPLPHVQIGEYEGGHGGAALWEETFVFDPPQIVAESLQRFRAIYAALEGREPIARSRWDVHVMGPEIVYLKDPCSSADLIAPFVLRLLPATSDHDVVLRTRSDDPFLWYWMVEFRKVHGGIRSTGSSMFDGKCLLRLLLPDWQIATIATGQRRADDDSVLWEAVFHMDVDRFRRAYDSAVAGQPLARAAFDIYRVGPDLIYVREPCASEDVHARFFLHVFRLADATDTVDAPDFANMDFDFNERGRRDDGRCVAVVPLPEYPVAQIHTGQWAAGGRVWTAEF